MVIESKIKIRHDSMFNIPQTNFKSAHLLNKMALVQFQRNSTVVTVHLLQSLVIKLAEYLIRVLDCTGRDGKTKLRP